MTFEQERSLESAYMMGTYGRSQVEFVRGQGMTLEDSEGKSYLDFLAGIGVCCLGHDHPAVVGAVTQQAQQLMHVSNYFYIEHRGEVAALISKLANNDLAGAKALADAICAHDADAVLAAAKTGDGEQVWQTFFSNSGAEANECSMKLARLYAQRQGNGGNTIVCLRGGFHGRTLETIAATMQDRLQNAFKPLPGGFVACTPNDIDELHSIFEQHAGQICAVMFEPIQGESGVHPLDDAFVQEAARLVHEQGGLVISDEVQAGIFRTGEPFAIQRAQVVPDIMSLAKGIAGGVPAGACVARAEVAAAFHPGDHGSTFGGSCLAVAAAEAVLCELVRGDYAGRAAEVGAYMAESLAEVPHVVEVRGAGLMIGCDLDEAAGDAHDVVAAALEAGLIFNAPGAHTLRFLPPLICTKEDVDVMIERLTSVLA